MEKNQSSRSSNSEGVCEKIYNAITFRSADRKTQRVKDHIPRSESVSRHQPNSGEVIPFEFGVPIMSAEPEKMNGQGHGQIAKVAPALTREAKPPNDSVQEKPKRMVDMVPPSNAIIVQSHGQGAKAASKVEPEKTRVSVQEQLKPNIETASPVKADDDNGKFSDYINRAKNKIMRTMTNVGGGKSTSRLDSFNGKVSNFINRTKIKVRTTSNDGGGKSVSFK